MATDPAPAARAEPAVAATRGLEWIKAVAMPLASVLITIIGGAYVSGWSKDREARDTNERLYTQLMTQREQSDATLRKDMFGVVLARFLGEGKTLDWDDKILQLELLANNFNQSLDLSPLFKDIARRLTLEKTLGPAKRTELIERMDKTASALNFKQVIALARRGYGKERNVSILGDGDQALPDERRVFEEAVSKSTLRVVDATIPADEALGLSVDIIGVDLVRREIQAKLVARIDADRDHDIVRTFWVGRYDFPMLDNTQLPDGLRAAVVLTEFVVPSEPSGPAKISGLTMHLIVFPAASASFKERQDYDDLLRDMLRTQKASKVATKGP